HACDGVPAAGPEMGGPKPTRAHPLPPLRLLSPRAAVVSGVLCTWRYSGTGQNGAQGIQSVVPIPPKALAKLVAALRLPDDSGGWVSRNCDSYLAAVPDFVLTLADGSRIRPGAPG